LIRVTYTDDSRDGALDGVQALVGALAPTSATPTVPPGTLLVSEGPSSARRGDGPLNPLVGAVLGGLVGLFGALLLRRMDPVVNGAGDLSMIPLPATELDGPGPLLSALADRWMGGTRPGTPVAAVTV